MYLQVSSFNSSKLKFFAGSKFLSKINDFFDFELSQHIKENFPRASIITANNVFAHCDDLIGIVKGVKNLLSESKMPA